MYIAVKTLLFVTITLNALAYAEAPKWLIDHYHESYVKTGSSCVGMHNGAESAKQLATIHAMSSLALQFGGEVTASRLVSNVTVDNQNHASTEKLEEHYQIENSHKLNGLETIDQGVYEINGIKHLCLWLGLYKE